MFDELKPEDVPTPPAHALNEAMRRGTGLRRRRRAAWASGAAAVVILVVVVVLGRPFGTTDAVDVVPATATATPRNYAAIPLEPTEEKDQVSFGYLQRVTQAADGSLTLRIQPAYFITGDAAAAANGGETPPDDYLSDVKPGTSPADVRLDPKASLIGVYELLGDPDSGPTDGTPITAAELLTNFRKADDRQLMLWMRTASDGSITALREQFTP